MLVAALSTGQKIGLASVGGAFILFALVCSFVVPRRNPNFPGKNVGWFVVVCVAFLVAMISAVLVFGKEKEEKAGAAAAPAATTSAAPTTTAATTTGGAATTTGAAAAVKGDPAAGKAVFASAGCTGCHTLKAAHATGTVGPNLDTLKPAYDKVVHQVEVGGGAMPPFKGQLSQTQIDNVSAFVYTSTHS